jgi:hypothetical protein
LHADYLLHHPNIHHTILLAIFAMSVSVYYNNSLILLHLCIYIA